MIPLPLRQDIFSEAVWEVRTAVILSMSRNFGTPEISQRFQQSPRAGDFPNSMQNVMPSQAEASRVRNAIEEMTLAGEILRSAQYNWLDEFCSRKSLSRTRHRRLM